MSGSGINPTMPGAAQGPAPKGQVVQIVSLPEGLENNARAIRIQGEVVQQNKDGSVRVRTEHGDIDIQVRGKQPQPSTKIEIDVPAGNPPRQATIRQAQAQTPQPQMPPETPRPQSPAIPQTPVTQQPAQPPRTDGQTQTPQAPVTRPAAPSQGQAAQTTDPVDHFVSTRPAQTQQSATPVQTTTPTATTAQVNIPTTLPPLSTGQSVQLLPLSDAETIEQTLQNGILTKATAQAGLIAQKAQGGIISNMLQAVKSVLPNFPAITAGNMPANPALQNIHGTAQSSIIPTGTGVQMAGNNILPSIPLPNAPVTVTLGAQIVSITQPLGQRIFVPTPQASITTMDIASSIPKSFAQPNGVFLQQAAEPITVTVEQATAQNKPVIKIPLQNGSVQSFVLQASSTATPPGTQISILPQLTITTALTTPQTGNAQITIPQIPAGTVSAMPPAWRSLLPMMQPAPIWPVIDELFQTFYQTTPQAAQILGRIMPSPANAANFGAAALLFVAAAKSGDLQSWLGDKKLDMINKLGKASLVSRLSSETAQLSQNADAPATDWKSYPFPLLHQNEISKIMLHLRREPDENENAQDKDATHFVMDVALTRMGNVQLDAFVRGNRVDLVVRTELPVSSSMQDAMRVAYAQALDNTNIYGEIGFQSDIKNFVRVVGREEALASV